MDTKHTPGPWACSRMILPPNTKDRRSGFVVNGPDIDNKGPLPVRVCELRVPQGANGFGEGEANARLIAAAPALLAALEGVMECEVAACNGCDEYGGFSDQIITPRFDAARAAIAAAKGEA